MRTRLPAPASRSRSGSGSLQPLRTAMPSALAALLRSAPLSDGKIGFAWQTAVGPAMARATRVHLAEGARLEVEAADARWAREVRQAIPVIRPRLDALLGAGLVRTVRVRSGRSGG